jgi:hypothetical protein
MPEIEITDRFRITSFVAGLVLLMGIGAAPGGTPQSIFVVLTAAPFLLLPLFRAREAAVFTASFLTGYGAVLTPALYLATLGGLVLSFEKGNGALFLIMAAALTVVLVLGIASLRRFTESERGAIPGGIIMGVLYFPVLYFALSSQMRPVVRHAQELYWPTSCALKYQSLNGRWANSLKEIEELPGCGGIDSGFKYERTGSGFILHTTNGQPLFYTDESGMIRINGLNGQVADTAGSDTQILLYRLAQWERSHDEYPLSLENILQLDDWINRVVKDGKYVVHYERIDPHRFRLTERPSRYGYTGLRSYYVDEAQIIHATSFDRDANAADVVAPKCEITGLAC